MVKIKSNLQCRGFTLIEIIFALAIGSLLVLMVSAIFILSQKTVQKTDVKAELTQNARSFMERIGRDLRQTPQIITFLPATDSAPADMPDHIIFRDGQTNDSIRYIHYYLASSTINRRVSGYYLPDNPGTYVDYYSVDASGSHALESILEDYPVAELVSELRFYGENKLVNFQLVLEKNGGSFTINSSIGRRN